MDTLTKRLKDIREDRDLTQSQVAAALHTSQRVYSRYETGIRALPIEHLMTLCKLYDLSADYILGFTSEARPLPKK